MSWAYRCEICDLGDALPDWVIVRSGDVVTTWACHDHLADVCANLQRMGERTELTVLESVVGR